MTRFAPSRPVNDHLPLVLILLGSLLLRALIPIAAIATHHDPGVFRWPDTQSYLRAAQSLVDRGRFDTQGVPDVHRTPGYPLFLLPGIIVGHVDMVTIILQIIVSALTVFLVYRIGLRLAGRRTALWAAVLYAVEPLSVFYASQLLSETLFTFFIVLFVNKVIDCLERPTMIHAVTASLAITVATYVRPIGMLLPLLTAVVLLAAALVAGRGKEVFRYTVVGLGIFVIFTGMWCVRNYRQTGYLGFSSIADESMYFYDAAATIAKQKGISFQSVQDEWGYLSDQQYVKYHPEQATWTDGERFAFMGREGRRLILKSPRIYAGIRLRGIGFLMLEPGAVNWSKTFKKYPADGGLLHQIVDSGLLSGVEVLRTKYAFTFYSTVVLGIMLVGYMALACIGINMLRRRARVASALMATVIVYFVVVSAGPQVESRFRHPVMPAICIFAGYAVAEIGKRRKGSKAAPIGDVSQPPVFSRECIDAPRQRTTGLFPGNAGHTLRSGRSGATAH
jgi:hypothetical protein